MNKHSSFTEKISKIKEKEFYYVEPMKKYENGDFRIVGYDLKEGTIILIGYDMGSQPIYHTISTIKEQHLSAGIFDNHERPQSYRVTTIPNKFPEL